MLHREFILTVCEQQREVDMLEAGRPQEAGHSLGAGGKPAG